MMCDRCAAGDSKAKEAVMASSIFGFGALVEMQPSPH